MDGFISKLKSKVSDVLPGNPLNGDFEILPNIVATAGPGLLWNVYKATKKNTKTKQDASVFVLNKKSLENLPKDERKMVIEVMRGGVQQLTRLRHPKILSVMHPIEESRECLAFATEPVWASLANVLQNRSSDEKLDETEIKYGLLQVLEALSFLHDAVKLVHGNLTPASIIINEKKMWKLSGFEYFIPNSGTVEQPLYRCNEWRSGQVPHTQPTLDFLAPECFMSSLCDPRSDLFSLGVTVFALYNDGKPVFQSHDNLSSYKRFVSEMVPLRGTMLLNIPATFRNSYASLLSVDPSQRSSASSLCKVSFFDDIGVMTLVYLDSLVQRDNLQRSQYFKNLPNVIRQLPYSLCVHRVLPALFDECSTIDMIPFVLQNILIIAEQASKSDYAVHIFPKLAPLLRMHHPIQIPLLLMKSMQLLLEKTDTGQTKAYILPMLLKTIEIHDNAQLQELGLSSIPTIAHLIDKHMMKTEVVPRVKKLCIYTQVLNIRVQCLVCVGKMMKNMDKWFVIDEILPFLSQVPAAREPAVIMSLLGIYNLAFSEEHLGITKDVLATSSLPFLLPLSVDNSLSRQQFCSFMTLIKDMIGFVEKEHLAKLDNLERKEHNEKSGRSDGTRMEEFLRESGLGTKQDEGQGMKTSTDSHVTPQPTALAAAAQPQKLIAPPKIRDLSSTLGSSLVKPTASVTPIGTSANNRSTPQTDPSNTGWNFSSTTSGNSSINWSTPIQSNTSLKPMQPATFAAQQHNTMLGTMNSVKQTQPWPQTNMTLGSGLQTGTSSVNNPHMFTPTHSTGLLSPQQNSSTSSRQQNSPSHSPLSQSDIKDLLG